MIVHRIEAIPGKFKKGRKARSAKQPTPGVQILQPAATEPQPGSLNTDPKMQQGKK